MRTRALSGALLLALSTVPAPTAGQSYTQVDLSYGLFDGVGIGMTHVAHVATNPAFGASVGSPYGIYSDAGRDYRDDYRYSGYDDYSDWCWDEAWELRWGRGYYGWDSRYDHLDFYHDCRSGGLDYAYDQWRWHSRRARYYDHYDSGWGWGRRSGVYVSVYVTDPFWRPWGPYWSYDPYGWYWDGYRDGWRDGRWARGGGVIYAGPFGGGRVRTVYAGRPSPLAPTRFKEDPRVLASDGGVRRAQPRAQGAAPVAPARASGRPSATAGRGEDAATGSARGPAPTAPARRGARPSATAGRGEDAAGLAPSAPTRRGERPTAAARPSDRIRGGEPASGADRPAIRPDGGETRARPSAPAGGAARARPSDPSVREGDAGTRRAPSAPATRERVPAVREPATTSAPERPSARQPSRESAPAVRQPSRETPSARPSRERAPAAREPAREAPPAARQPAREPSRAPAPAARQPSREQPSSGGGSTRSAPRSTGESARPAPRSSGGSERSAPAARRPATR